MVNPLSPYSDQNHFSLFNFNTFKPREKVLRTNEMITEEKTNVVIEILRTSSLWKYMEISL